MQKEDIKFLDSTVFEGMTSIRAIISSIDAGTNNRKIEKVLYLGTVKGKEATRAYFETVNVQ